MQSILYHNASGDLAFTGNLKKKEVHHAITMHPVKDYKHMLRMETYLKNLKIQDLKEVNIHLHQDIATAAKELNIQIDRLPVHSIAQSVPLYPHSQGSLNYLGDTSILGVPPSLSRYRPREVKDVLTWSFFSKMISSIDNLNPKRRLDFQAIEGLEDIIRELMETINAYSKQRGRVIEYKETLYGYERLDPIHGADYILDILLVYKKYRGRKMTLPVRRHAYLQQSFTGIEIREVPLGESPVLKLSKDESVHKLDYDFVNNYENDEALEDSNRIPFLNFKKLNVPIKNVLESSLTKLSKNFPSVFKRYEEDESSDKKVIYFIVTLSGRYSAFMRFLSTYEEVCLRIDKRTVLVITLYKDIRNPADYDKTLSAIDAISLKYPQSEIVTLKMNDTVFSRGLSLQKGVEVCQDDGLLFFVDVDITFDLESLQRIRWNTIRHRTAYFPIVFSEYNPHIVNGETYNSIKTYMKNKYIRKDVVIEKKYVIGENKNLVPGHETTFSNGHGYFRQFGFGIVSCYKSDFVAVGGFNTDIRGWGFEDVNLYDKFVKSNLTVFRSVDRGLLHVFHTIDCDKTLDVTQYKMCVGSRANTYGSAKHMVIYLINNPDVLLRKISDGNAVGDDGKPQLVPDKVN